MTATPAPQAPSDGARPRVLLLFGGRSSEHPISCVTAAGVLHAADPQRWDVVPVGVARSGLWSHDELDVAAFRLDGETLPEVPEPEAPVSLRTPTSRGTGVARPRARADAASADLPVRGCAGAHHTSEHR